jgi:predicted ester cyclase
MTETRERSMRERREAIVLEHVAAENRHDVDATIRKIHHADDAVIGEVRVAGTHDGSWGGIPATGHRVDFPAACVFDFEEDRLVCEKVYFDSATLLRQIGVLPDPATA